MIAPILPATRQMAKRVPYVEPVISAAGLALDVKEIVDNSTPIGAAKFIGARFLKKCLPPKVFIAGKCVMVVGGVMATISTGGNPMVISATRQATRSVVKEAAKNVIKSV